MLEDANKKLLRAHNQIINDINEKVHCDECRKRKIAHAKKQKRKFSLLYASLLGAYTHNDYSAHPEKLFDEEEDIFK